MLDYEVVKRKRREHLALTGLTIKEFKKLLAAFEQAEREKFERENAEKVRQREPGGGRTATLHNSQQRLLFILVYFKTYTLQVVHGALFDLSQSRTNRLIHELTPILLRALDIMGVVPEGPLGAAWATLASYALSAWLSSFWHPAVREVAGLQTRALLLPLLGWRYLKRS